MNIRNYVLLSSLVIGNLAYAQQPALVLYSLPELQGHTTSFDDYCPKDASACFEIHTQFGSMVLDHRHDLIFNQGDNDVGSPVLVIEGPAEERDIRKRILSEGFAAVPGTDFIIHLARKAAKQEIQDNDRPDQE
jgi:hypothetical protein